MCALVTGVQTCALPIFERMVKEFDRNGRVAGAGFYDYPEERGAKKSLWPELRTLFEKPGMDWDITDIKDRLLYRQAVDTARCISENVLTSRSTQRRSRKEGVRTCNTRWGPEKPK